MSVGGALGAAFSFAFGEVGPLIFWLTIFVTADMLSGITAAIKSDTLSAKVLFQGSIRKVIMFCMIALAHGLDETLREILRHDFVQYVVIVSYTLGEVGSVIKNMEKAGLGSLVPPFLRFIVPAINQYLEKKAAKTLQLRLDEGNKNEK